MAQWWGRHGPTFPAHTLTFFFADLRDYTAFVEKRGDQAAAALLDDYRRLVRSHIAGTGGGEIKTEGDSFFVVFSTARQALHCAMGILRDAERRAVELPDRPLRIGIGLHAGEPVPQGGGYVGSAVNIAARLAQQAQAGELLVSEVVRGLLRTFGTPPMEERAELRLKGVDDPPRIYRVLWGAADATASLEPTVPVTSARALALGPLRLPLPAAAVTAAALALALGAVGLAVVATRPPAAPAATVIERAPAEASRAAAQSPRAGPLLWSVAFDGSGSELERQEVVGDPQAAEVRNRPGEVELAVLRPGGSALVIFRRSAPDRFVAELDVAVSPGTDARFVWSMRRSEKAEHEVRLEAKSEEIWISYNSIGVRSDRISARPVVPGLGSGQRVTLAIVADGSGYSLYVDGRRVADATDARLADLATPFGIQVAGRAGSVRVSGLRVYALAAP